MNNKPFSMEEVARKHAYSKFPLASKKENEKLVEDWVNKIEITKNIVVDFKLRVGDPRGMKILDAGSGNGGTCISFAEAGAEAFGIDVENNLVEIAKSFAESRKTKAEFILYDGKTIPFSDNTFDAVLSVSVLEHVTDPVNYLSEILRVLKPGGYFYLAFPNRLWPRETHTLLWGTTYLPYKMAEFVTRLFKRNPLSANNLHFYTYWNLKKMLREAQKNEYNFEIKQETGKSQNVIKNFIKTFLEFFGISYKYFLPHIQLILTKMPAHNASRSDAGWHSDTGGENKKIKIAFMTDVMDRRPEKVPFFRKLFENLLDHSEFEIYLLHYKQMPDDSLYKRANEIILPKISLPWGSHFVSFLLFCLTTKQRFDIFQWFVPRLYPFFWLVPAKKLVVMAHGGGSVTAPVIFTVPNLIFNFVMKFFNKYIDAVIGVSEFGSKEIIYAYHIPPEKVFTIYPVVDPVYRVFPREDIAGVLAKYKITADKYFLYVGGMQMHKNAKGLIKSYILLRQETPEITEKLIIVGIYNSQQIEKICRDTNLKETGYYNDIIFSGYGELKDMPAFHGGATALVFPSLNEGFGMPIVEAMTCGTPVITSNVTSMPEIAKDAAILVNPYNIKDIMNAMKKIATDYKIREELIKKGFERTKFFSWRKCMNSYIALYRKILYN